MHVLQKYLLPCIGLFLVVVLVACDTDFQSNPHGPAYVDALTPLTTAPAVPTGKVTTLAHLSPFGLGASLQALVSSYGKPTSYSAPPLYAFQDGPEAWPKGSLIVVTMKDGQAVEFSYVPGSDHPMTYQEAQDWAVKLLPDNAQGPTTIQKEDDHLGKCLAKTYSSNLLKTLFPADDFMAANGSDGTPGTVTVNFFPDAATNDYDQYENGGNFGSNVLIPNQVNSVLVNLGSRPSC